MLVDEANQAGTCKGISSWHKRELSMKQKQTGFSLIELAIVLVIIGLLLGGVLKGQELINSAKAKSMIGDFKNAQIFIYGYLDRYRALPGDDVAASTHVAGAGNGNGNGIIDGAWNAGVGAESALFWQHVRLAGFATGPTDINAPDFLPRNSEGGRIGVQSINNAPPINGLTGTYVACSQNLSGSIAKQIDLSLDDGETSTGNVMAIVAGNAQAVAAAAIVDGSPYTVCMSF